MIDPKGSRPEALATFGRAARKAGKPNRMPLEANDETAPLPGDNEKQNEAATRVLREGTFHDDEGSEELIKELPDRITHDRNRDKRAKDDRR